MPKELFILLKDREDTNADTPISVFDSIESAKSNLESEYRDNPGYRFEERQTGCYSVHRLDKHGGVLWTDRYSVEMIDYFQD